MKKEAIASILIGLSLPFLAGALSVYMPFQGGTGTSTIPTYGQVLMGDGTGKYAPVSTSTFGWVPYTGATADVDLGNHNLAVSGTTTLASTTVSGKVGIGTTTPSELLEVAGNIELQKASNTTAIKMYDNANLLHNITAISSALQIQYGIPRSVALFNNIITGTPQLQIWGYDTGARAKKYGSLRVDANDGSFLVSAQAGEKLKLRASSTVDGLTVDTTGNIGIGTTNPTYPFVVATSGTDRFSVVGNGNYNNVVSTGGILSSGGINAGFFTTTGKGLAWDSSLTRIIGNGQTGGTTNYMAFYTSSTEAMRITNAGNIGIGTTNPQNLLHISSTTGNARLEISGGSGKTSEIYFSQGNDRTNAISVLADGDLAFYSNPIGSDGWTQRLVIDNATGNMGLGTSTLSDKLVVVGTTTTSNLKITSLANTVLAVDGSGNVIATTTGGGGSGEVTYAYASSTYVPYTGATTALNMGNHAITSNAFNVKGVGSIGYINFYDDSSNSTGLLEADVDGQFSFQSSGAGYAIINVNAGNTTYSIPAKGSPDTFAMVSDITNFMTYSYASSTFPSFAYASSTYLTTDSLAGYLSTTTAAATYVPYTGATTDVNIGAHALTVSGNTTLATTTVSQLSTTGGIVKRTVGYTASTTITINSATTDIATTSLIYSTTTFANPSGTALDSQSFAIKAYATTTRGLAWGANFASTSALTLPTSQATGTMWYGFTYDAGLSKWCLMATQGPF